MPEFKWNIKEDGIDEVFDERGYGNRWFSNSK